MRGLAARAGWLAVALAAALFAPERATAQCTCALPGGQLVCPLDVCATCSTYGVSCQCTTPCDYGDCSSGYTQISQSLCAFPPFSDTETCRLSGTRYTCTTCQPGRFGVGCVGLCPGGTGNTCNQHGSCSEGVSGDGSCTCAPGYAGSACQLCAANHYGYPACVFCTSEATCSGQGSCAGDGSCACDPGFGGADCRERCGDVDDDGAVGPADVAAYRAFLADPSGAPLSPAGVSKCSVIDSAGPCEILDVSVLRRALAEPPLPPGIESVCPAVTG